MGGDYRHTFAHGQRSTSERLFDQKAPMLFYGDELSHVLHMFTAIFALFSLYFGLKLSLKRTLFLMH